MSDEYELGLPFAIDANGTLGQLSMDLPCDMRTDRPMVWIEGDVLVIEAGTVIVRLAVDAVTELLRHRGRVRP